jgi:hypothetical protein
MLNILTYPTDRIYIISDIHGEFDTLNYLIHKKYQIKRSLFIQVGDFGVGFYKENYYINKLNWFNNELSENDNTLLVIRGNHDNGFYFNDQEYNNKYWNLYNLKLLPDYSLVSTDLGNILCIGGEASIDYKNRIEGRDFWKDELPIFDEEKLKYLNDNNILIDYVVTHGMPTFTYPLRKYTLGIVEYIDDKNIAEYSGLGRKVFDMVYQYLVTNNNHPIKKWYSGHYHEYHFENVMGIDFIVLDINEIKEL